jgi:hypothetical protein
VIEKPKLVKKPSLNLELPFVNPICCQQVLNMHPELKSNRLPELDLIAFNYFSYLHPSNKSKNHSVLFRSNPKT